jgi:hypothetical protein
MDPSLETAIVNKKELARILVGTDITATIL